MSLLETDELYIEYTSKKGLTGAQEVIHAVNGVNLDIRRGEILSVAGESGCGKSTTGRCILRLIEPDNGEVIFHGQDILKMKNKDVKSLRKNMQIIFQNPYSSLNPRMKIKDILAEPLKLNTD